MGWMFIGFMLLSAKLNAEVSSELFQWNIDKVYTASNRPTGAFIADGLIIGGDASIDDLVIKNLRLSPLKQKKTHPPSQRIVFDLLGLHQAHKPAIERPSYFQVHVHAALKQVDITFWGHPKLNFNAAAIQKTFKKAALFQSVSFFPPELEEDLWTMSIHFHQPMLVEVFELSQPLRVVIDIQPRAHTTH